MSVSLAARDGGCAPGSPGPTDAVVRASFAAPQTGAIGLIPVTSGLYGEPLRISTQLSTLDTLSSGQAGVIVIVDADARPAARCGLEPLDASQAQRRRGRDRPPS